MTETDIRECIAQALREAAEHVLGSAPSPSDAAPAPTLPQSNLDDSYAALAESVSGQAARLWLQAVTPSVSNVKPSTSGPLAPEIHAALVRQEAHVKAAARRAELAEEHEGWRSL